MKDAQTVLHELRRFTGADAVWLKSFTKNGYEHQAVIAQFNHRHLTLATTVNHTTTMTQQKELFKQARRFADKVLAVELRRDSKNAFLRYMDGELDEPGSV